MGRTYRLGQREASVAETRARILTAARELLLGPDAMSISMDEIARRAGVSRQTVYQHFGARGDLLREVVKEAFARADGSRLMAAFREPDALEAYRGLIAGICRVFAAERRTLRQVMRLATTEAGVAEIERNGGEARRKFMEAFITRLDAAGLLREGVRPADALLVTETILRFEDFDYICTYRKIGAAKTTAILTDVLERAILREDVVAAGTGGELVEAEA